MHTSVHNTNLILKSNMYTLIVRSEKNALTPLMCGVQSHTLNNLPQALLMAGFMTMIGLAPLTYSPHLHAQTVNTSAAEASQKVLQSSVKITHTGDANTLPNEGVYFRRIDGVNLHKTGSSSSAVNDASVWRNSKKLPDGSKILMSLSAAKAPANGKSLLKVHVELFDAAGKKLTSTNADPIKLLIETTAGRLQLPGIVKADGVAATEQTVTELTTAEILLTLGEASFYLIAPTDPSDAVLRVSSGAVGVQGEVTFVPDLRPMLLVGIVEGAINFTKIKKTDANAPELIQTEFEDSLRNWSKSNSAGDQTMAGRVAFFAKGTIKGEYLLTAAADSDKITREKLFRDIDPNAFYPIYGDASSKQFDAQSTSRVYVRVDKDKSYLLYGDYSTASNDEGNKLASYNRSLTGAKWHYESQSVKINAFAASDNNRSYVDEQAGRGISGPYALGKPNAVANSEQIELFVRDRNAPAIVLKRQILARFVDYDFEPFSGRVLFRQPVPSVDENNNPVSIRIAYEVEEGGEKYWVSGVDAKTKLTDNIALGASFAQDRNPVAPFKLAGVNAEITLGAHTFIVAEVAKSYGNQYVNSSISPQLGLALNPAVDQSGRAARIELRHNGQGFNARAYMAKSDATFQNPSAGLTAGRQEAGINLQARATDAITLTASLQQTQDESRLATDGAKRDAASVGVSFALTDRIKLDVTANSVREKQVAGSGGFLSPTQAQQSSLPGLGWGSSTSFGFDGTGLLASPTTLSAINPNAGSPDLVSNEYNSLKVRLTVQATDSTSLYGEYERSGDDRQRVAVGGEHRINEKSRMYARHEFANSLSGTYGLTADGSKTTNTTIGVDTSYMQDGQLFSEYRLAGAQNGRDAAGALGLRNLWRIGEGFNLTTTLERQTVMPAASARQEATAISLGADYSANPWYKTGGKLEYRTSSAQQTWLSTLAYDRKFSEQWAAIVRNFYSKQSARGTGLALGNGTQIQDRFQLGLAYRDTKENLWHGLGRLEHRNERSDAIGNPASASTWIASLHGNYKPSRTWTYSSQVAYKGVNERFASPTGQVTSSGTGIAQLGDASTWHGVLFSGRVIWDFAERFDASLYGSSQSAQGSRLHGLGAELGYRVMNNLWISLGYTGGRYSDVDAFSSNQSWKAWHMRLRFKFDEKTFSQN